MKPRTSVIIPVYNASSTLRRCLEAIFRLDHSSYEVIVVDDGSTDASLEIAREFPVRVIRVGRNSGPAFARNEGAKAAEGSILAFTDADCEVPEDWLQKAERALSGDVAAVTGPYSRSTRASTLALFQHYETAYFQRHSPPFIASCTAGNLVCRRGPFLQVQGFPQVRVNEDMEFASRLARTHRIRWLKENGVAHNYRSSLTEYGKQQVAWAIATAGSYLSNLRMLGEQGSISKAEVALHLTLFGVLVLALAVSAVGQQSAVLPVGVLALILVLNFRFLAYLEREQGLALAICGFFLVFYRYAAWALGCGVALLVASSRLLWGIAPGNSGAF